MAEIGRGPTRALHINYVKHATAQGSNAGRHPRRRVEARGGVFVLWCTCSSRRSDVRDVQIRCSTVVARPSPARKSERSGTHVVHRPASLLSHFYIQLNMVPHPGLRILAISRTGTTNNFKDPIFDARSVKQRAVKRSDHDGPDSHHKYLKLDRDIGRVRPAKRASLCLSMPSQ